MKYQAELAYDTSSYATVEFKADNEDDAIVKALAMHEDGEDHGFSIEWSGVWNERIVNIVPIIDDEPNYQQVFAEGIELHPNPLHDNAYTLLKAAKDALATICALVNDMQETDEGNRWKEGTEQSCNTGECVDQLTSAIALCEGKES